MSAERESLFSAATRCHKVLCGCVSRCGDDPLMWDENGGEVDDGSRCKDLPRMPDPPLVQVVLTNRNTGEVIC